MLKRKTKKFFSKEKKVGDHNNTQSTTKLIDRKIRTTEDATCTARGHYMEVTHITPLHTCVFQRIATLHVYYMDETRAHPPYLTL